LKESASRAKEKANEETRGCETIQRLLRAMDMNKGRR